MTRWRYINQTWCNWPAKPIGLIEMIGGSYLSASPHISYKRLLEGLSRKNLAIHAWSYVPSFDHQSQANEAWKSFRICKKKLEERISIRMNSLRLGHSLGCKLHLLSPDGGRNSNALVSLSFNNFNAAKSIPMLGKLTSRLNIHTEFSPSPQETMRLISKRYLIKNNLIIKFENDKLDQSNLLLECLRKRSDDESNHIELPGDHLTPASAGIRQNILGEWAKDSKKALTLNSLIENIYKYSCDSLSS